MSEYQLSTELFALRRKLAEHHSGIVLTADEVVQMTGQLKTLGVIAQRNENDLRRLRASETVLARRRVGPSTETILSAVCQPGSNVHLLAIERPFDGAPQ